ncbi:MAG: tetratricopeptide repeat protein [Deltaproteobacteria bacterium]|nr:tetratricopeptide repeat protein [Deltaproteobacteria bacterium]
MSHHRLPSHPAVLAAILVGLTLAAYTPVLRAGYIWDDEYLIVDSPDMQTAAGLSRIWFSTKRPDYYPVAWTFFWSERQLWGRSAAGYHVVNLLLHTAAVLLVWRVLVRLAIPGAWLASALFAVHPVTVASVAWITEGKNTLSLIFYALAALLYLRADDDSTSATPRRRRLDYGLALCSFAAALLSKTSGVLLPMVLLGCAWWRRGRVSWADTLRALPFFALAGMLSVVGIWFQIHRAIGANIVRPEGVWSRLAAAGWIVWFYLYKAFAPIHLSMVYPRWNVDPTLPLSWVPLAVLVGCLWLCWGYRHRIGRGALFASLYVLAMLFPVLGCFDMNYMRFSLVADHFQYLALIGTLAPAAAAAACALRDGRPTVRRFTAAGAAAVVLLLAVLTFRQSQTYESEETLWRATLAENPDAVVAHGNLGVELLATGRFAEALEQYEQGLTLDPTDAGLHYGSGSVLARQERFAEAASEYREALRLKPDYAEAHNNLGLALAHLGDAAARVEYEAALRDDPGFAEAYNNLGALLQQGGDVLGAEVQYKRALALKPEHVEAHFNMGNVHLAAGNLEAAITSYRTALRYKQDHVGAHQHLGLALARTGSMQEAIAEYRAALALKPNDASVLNELAWFLATHPDGRYRNGTEAVSLARLACEQTDYSNPFYLDTLAAAYAEAGRSDEAADTEQRALKLGGQDAQHLARMRQRLQLYSGGSRYRDPPVR